MFQARTSATRLFTDSFAWITAVTALLLFTGGCADVGEGYYGEAALPASYYYGPDFYDPGYPYYYHLHDSDWWRHHDDRDHWGDHDRWARGGRENWAARRGGAEEGARTAGHRQRPDGGGSHFDGGHPEGGGHSGAATAGGRIDGSRR